jgi:hypothetical protein
MSENTSWNEIAYRLIYEAARKLRIGVEKAKSIAEDAVRIAGPGKGHRRVGYRIIPAYSDPKRKCVNGYIVYETVNRDAHTEAVEKATYVSERDVMKLWRVIKKNFPLNPKLTSEAKPYQVGIDYKFNVADVAEAMIKAKMLPPRFNYETFSGGAKRANHYFPQYLFPMRVLDYLNYVRFGMVSWRTR